MAAAVEFDFLTSKEKVKCLISESLLQNKVGDSFIEDVKAVLDTTGGNVTERCTCLDLVLRENIKNRMREEQTMEQVLHVVELTLLLTDKELCSYLTIFSVLLDLADLASVSQCEQLFEFVESKMHVWKTEPLFSKGKNHLLRMCNDILKKLSKSQDTVFCGRIQLFLARLFPLTEKSGLNLFGEFSLDNLTVFSNLQPAADTVELPPGVDEEKMETEEPKEELPGEGPIDYTFYTKFWSLQDFFREPNQCYTKPGWKKFSMYSDTVLDAFSTMKLDNSRLVKHRKHVQQTTADMDQLSKHKFFAKYLTSDKLFNLQLSDSCFRRYLLVQMLILFHYLRSDVKYKSKTMELSDEMKKWINKTESTIYNLIKETPPNGSAFANTVKNILIEEDRWNTWKNLSCPSFVRRGNANDDKKRIIVRKRSMIDDLNLTERKKHNLGNDELNRLWNLHPDNDSICKSEARQFVPALDSFFEDAIMAADPSNQIEQAYKDVHKPGWQWRALRLLSKKSRFLFEQTQTPARPIPTYLDELLRKYSKEIAPSAAGETPNGADIIDQDVIATEGHDQQDDDIIDEADSEGETTPKETLNETEELPDEPEVTSSSYITSDHISQLAELLQANWKQLANKLDFIDEEILYFDNKEKSAQTQAKNMLTVWKEGDGSKATVGVMYKILKALKLGDIAMKVFGQID